MSLSSTDAVEHLRAIDSRSFAFIHGSEPGFRCTILRAAMFETPPPLAVWPAPAIDEASINTKRRKSLKRARAKDVTVNSSIIWKPGWDRTSMIKATNSPACTDQEASLGPRSSFRPPRTTRPPRASEVGRQPFAAAIIGASACRHRDADLRPVSRCRRCSSRWARWIMPESQLRYT